MLVGDTVRVKWYRKESNKNIILHAKSSHPTAMKRAIIRNMFKTAAEVCSGEDERQQSLELAAKIARTNGYQQRPKRTRRTVMGAREHDVNRISLCLPFISDHVNNAIREGLIQAQLNEDVVLVNIPSDNIKRRLVRNRLYDRTCISRNCVVCPFGKVGDCAVAGVVYQIECLACHAIYIGETGRLLSVRVNEHLASKRRQSLVSPLGRHRKEDHSGTDFEISCTILAFEDNIASRKALEALWIMARDPSMNNKNEQLSITRELMPFLSYCAI